MRTLLVFCSIVLFTYNSLADELTVIEYLLDRGHTNQAAEAYQALNSEQQNQLRGQLIRSQLLVAENAIEAAWDLSHSLVQAHPKNANVQYRFGRISVDMISEVNIFRKPFYAKGALNALKKAEELDPAFIDAKIALAHYYLNAPGIAGGDNDLAIKYAEKVRQSSSIHGYPLLLKFHLKLKNYSEAKLIFQQAIQVLEDSSELFYIKALNFASQQAWDQAFEHLLIGLQATNDPRNTAKIRYQIGRIACLSKQNVTLGITSLKAVQVSDFNADPDWTNLRLAQLLFLNNDYQNALAITRDIDSKDKTLNKQLKKLTRNIRRNLR